jgi:hypothetical protein
MDPEPIATEIGVLETVRPGATGSVHEILPEPGPVATREVEVPLIKG